MQRTFYSQFLLLIICLFPVSLFSQVQKYVPTAHWDFEADNWSKPRVGAEQDDFFIRTHGGFEINSESNNKYYSSDPANITPISIDLVVKNALSVEFMFRMDREQRYNYSSLFNLNDNSIVTSISPTGLEFNTITLDEQEKAHSDLFKIPFDGSDLLSYAYYLDEAWHHIVFKFDAATGKKEIWVDGKSHPNLKRTVTQKGRIGANANALKRIYINHYQVYNKSFQGDLDDFTIYHNYIPDALHGKHFRDRKSGRPLSFEVDPGSILPPDNDPGTVGEIDLMEFPPGHPNVEIPPLEQLRSFPLARFKEGHSLNYNMNWIDPIYFAGEHLAEISKPQASENAVEISRELSQNWHYMLNLWNANLAPTGNLTEYVDAFLGPAIELANENPQWPLSIITIWQGVNTYDEESDKYQAMIIRQDLDSHNYLQNKNGQYISSRGALIPNNGRKEIGPEADYRVLRRDGETNKEKFDHILGLLTRPIDLINENGEVFPLPIQVSPEEMANPIIKAREKYELTHQELLSGVDQNPNLVSKPASKSWDLYQANRKTRLRNSYRDALLDHPDMREKLKNTKYTWYAVDGGPPALDRFEWLESRKIMRPIRGQYYSTPNFYPRWPDNWRKWRGSSRGLEWLEISRKKEILAGDKLFSPYVAAGWNQDPEKNIRPSQWLGLLKLLNIMGAEFFYTGVFHERKKIYFANPFNYTWQAAMPIYAQAVASRYEETLLEGDVLYDDEGVPILLHSSGNPTIPLAVRKHATEPIYIIGGSVQPFSNIKGNVPDSAIASLDLNDQKLNFHVRRQGSVYKYDLRDPQNPVFYQLDKWHETGHPYHWKPSFFFDAEVNESTIDLVIKTELPEGAAPTDFSNFTSYLSSEKGKRGIAKFNFTYRGDTKQKFRIKVRARSRDGKSSGITIVHKEQFSFLGSNPVIGKFCIKNKDWEWQTVRKCKRRTKYIYLNAKPGSNEFLFIWDDDALELDAIELYER